MNRLEIFWSKFKIKVVSAIVNIFASQTNDDIKNTVLLIGSARSGTTFLMESLNSRNEYRIIFEPFNPTYTQEWESFGARHYIDPGHVKEKEAEAIHKILQGNINNKWVDQYNRKVRSDQRLIKSVRANLMLDYFENEYPELQIIYIHRNPYDVVASRINLNFDAKDVFLVLEHHDFITKYYSDIDITVLHLLLITPEHCHAALWCFENRYILERIGKSKIIEAKYEDIIGKTVLLNNEKLLISNGVRRPSVTSSLQKSYKLSETENGNISVILTLFSMDKNIVDEG